MAQAMENMRKEAAKMDGVSVLTVMKVNGAGDGPSSGTPETQTQQSKPQAKPDLGSVLGGRLGGFGGFGGRKKKQQEDTQVASTPPPSENASASSSLIEMTTESSNFSSAPVDASRFSAPAGFKKVESEMMKHQRQ